MPRGFNAPRIARAEPRCGLWWHRRSGRRSPPRASFPLTCAGFFCIPHRKIVSKIDEDKDGFVTVEELKDWIKFAQKRWIYEDVERQWKGHDLNEDGLISWEEYKNATYGYILGRSLRLGPKRRGAGT